MSEILVRGLLPMGLAGSLFYLLLQPLRPLFSRLRASWRKAALLLCALLLCALLFVLPFPLLFSGGEESPSALGAGGPTAPVYTAGQALGSALRDAPAPATTPPNSNTQPGSKTPAPSPSQILTWVYWAGFAGLSAASLVRYALLMCGLKRSAQAPLPEDAKLYAHICRGLGLARPPALGRSGSVAAPVLAGVFRPRILLPQQDITPTQMRFALQHELCHHTQRDIPLKLFVLGVALLHWYNPAAHLLLREFGDACEQSCDEAVTRELEDPQRKHYAGVLLDFAGPTPSSMVSSFASPAKKLRLRLRRLMLPAKPGALRKTAGVLLPTVLLAAALLAGCSLAAGAGSSGEGLPPTSGHPEALSSSSGASASASAEAPPSSSSAAPSGTGSSLPVEPEDPNTPNEEAVPAGGQAFINPVPTATHLPRDMSDGGHRGLDLDAPKGDTIYAVADGVVTTAEWHYSYGNYITIDHGNGLYTLYAHCEELFAANGQQVKQGDAIATVGNSGSSSASHLHLEVTENGELKNPADYLNLPEDLL